MKPEAQRIAIAEACGWTPAQIAAWVEVEERRRVCEGTRCGSFSRWEAVDKLEKAGSHPNYAGRLPDYLTDLNAMHETEKALTDEQRFDYFYALNDALNLVSPSEPSWIKEVAVFAHCHATAAQRAEAFLRATNRWREETK